MIDSSASMRLYPNILHHHPKAKIDCSWIEQIIMKTYLLFVATLTLRASALLTWSMRSWCILRNSLSAKTKQWFCKHPKGSACNSAPSSLNTTNGKHTARRTSWGCGKKKFARVCTEDVVDDGSFYCRFCDGGVWMESNGAVVYANNSQNLEGVIGIADSIFVVV